MENDGEPKKASWISGIKNFLGIIDNPKPFELPTDDEPYINLRLGRFIKFFNNERIRNRHNERVLQYLIIGFGALIPIVNVVGISSPLSNILSSVFGGIVVVSTGFLQFEKYHEKWLISKTTATKLANQYYYWKNKVGEYALPSKNGSPVPEEELKEKGLEILVSNCESMILSEANEFVGLFNTSDGIPKQPLNNPNENHNTGTPQASPGS